MMSSTSHAQQRWSILFLWMGLLVGVPQAAAQKAEVELTVNATEVSQGDMLRLTVTFVNCKVKRIDPPQIQGLDWRMGPSTSNSTQWVNGVTTSEQSYTYGYTVVGNPVVQIPALSWTTNKGILKSRPVRLNVTGKGGTGAGSQTKPRQSTKAVQRDLVTAIEPSKRTVYLGEPLVLTYKIYNRFTNLDVRNYDIPELEGFWKETVSTPDARWEPQLINGKRYNVATVKQIVAFPQQTGKVILKDFKLNGYMRVNFFEGKEVKATCDPVTIDVLPLPEVAPAQSLGTFANLSVSQSMSADSVFTNEAVTVEVRFRGSGNLKFLREPELAWPTEFEVFDAEVEDNISVSARGESGTRTFKFVAIPRAPGDYTMPEFEAVSFDPLTGTHVKSTAATLQLNVRRGATDGGAAGMTFSHQQDVQVLNQDVRHILTSPGRFLPRTRPTWTNWALGLAFASSPLAFAGAAWARRRRRHEAADWVGTRRKRALRDLHKSLGGASNIEAFGEAMEQYLMAKLGWERSQLTREAVHKRLSEVDPGLAEDWIALWNECEMQRYGAVSGNLESLAERLRSLAQKTETTWA